MADAAETCRGQSSGALGDYLMASGLMRGFLVEQAISESISRTLESYAPEVRDKVVILFSAHSLPLSVVK